MNILLWKRCTDCKRWKLRSEFYKNKATKDGLLGRCKKCQGSRTTQWKKDNPKRVSEIQKKFWSKYFAKNQERVRKNAKRYREENIGAVREKERERSRKRTVEEPEKWREVRRKSAIKNTDKHRDYRRTKAKNRRALKKQAVGKITVKEWKDLCEMYGNKCLRCGRSDVKLTLDHVVPLISGGSNTIDNAQPLCGNCNSIKGVKATDYRRGLKP